MLSARQLLALRLQKVATNPAGEIFSPPTVPAPVPVPVKPTPGPLPSTTRADLTSAALYGTSAAGVNAGTQMYMGNENLWDGESLAQMGSAFALGAAPAVVTRRMDRRSIEASDASREQISQAAGDLRTRVEEGAAGARTDAEGNIQAQGETGLVRPDETQRRMEALDTPPDRELEDPTGAESLGVQRTVVDARRDNSREELQTAIGDEDLRALVPTQDSYQAVVSAATDAGVAPGEMLSRLQASDPDAVAAYYRALGEDVPDFPEVSAPRQAETFDRQAATERAIDELFNSQDRNQPDAVLARLQRRLELDSEVTGRMSADEYAAASRGARLVGDALANPKNLWLPDGANTRGLDRQWDTWDQQTQTDFLTQNFSDPQEQTDVLGYMTTTGLLRARQEDGASAFARTRPLRRELAAHSTLDAFNNRTADQTDVDAWLDERRQRWLNQPPTDAQGNPLLDKQGNPRRTGQERIDERLAREEADFNTQEAAAAAANVQAQATARQDRQDAMDALVGRTDREALTDMDLDAYQRLETQLQDPNVTGLRERTAELEELSTELSRLEPEARATGEALLARRTELADMNKEIEMLTKQLNRRTLNPDLDIEGAEARLATLRAQYQEEVKAYQEALDGFVPREHHLWERLAMVPAAGLGSAGAAAAGEAVYRNRANAGSETPWWVKYGLPAGGAALALAYLLSAQMGKDDDEDEDE